MKISTVSACLVLMLTLVYGPSVHAQIPILKEASITFQTPTHTNDKAADTKVFVSVFTSAGVKVASTSTCCRIKFPDSDFTSPSYDLDIVSEVSKRGLQTGYLEVSIATTGAETWTFIPTLTLHFDDGTTRILNTFPTRVVDQYAKSTVFTFY